MTVIELFESSSSDEFLGNLGISEVSWTESINANITLINDKHGTP